MIGEPTLPAVASLGLDPVDEIHHVVEPATDPERMQLLAMAMARWVLPVPVPPTSTALRCWAEVTTGEITHERLVDRRTLELQVVEVLGERRVLMLLLASALGGLSIWMLLSELPRSGIQRLLINSDAAAIAATARARAAWAAAFGGVRGDLWAESAFTYATLLSPGPAPDAGPSTIANHARTVI
jgi:hypothetical protein